MSLEGKSVLVTGAGGFIGSHLVEALVGRGCRTRAFLHYNSAGKRGWLEQSAAVEDIDFHFGDVCDQGTLESAMQEVDIVFHLAALIAIPYSYRAPHSYVRVNVEGTTNALEAARRAGVQRFVHTSTSEVYGSAQSVPIDESHPLRAQSPYAASKIGADKMAESYGRSFDLPVVTLRPFNTYGPRQSARAVIPSIVTQCLTNRPIKLGNLSPTRDFCFVQDTVEGFLKASTVPGAEGRTIHLGTAREVSIRDLVGLIADLTGSTAEILTDPVRERAAASEVDRLLAAPDLAEETLGWRAEVDLEEGLRRTIEWLRDNLAHYKPDTFAV